ncbi:hypothetical protein LTR95_008089 [Oleoguttula sp. CCFEE 5521]
MQNAHYIYGCSTSTASFGYALGKATRIDVLLKADAKSLIVQGQSHPPRSVTGAVDTRSMEDVLASQDPSDPLQAFVMPEGWFAQGPRFVPASSNRAEDEGYLIFYAFDESQLTLAGDVPADSSALRAKSELWVVNANTMKDVAARIMLPQRVPYGLHGSWFGKDQIEGQRGVESFRTTARALEAKEEGWWTGVRDWVERSLS